MFISLHKATLIHNYQIIAMNFYVKMHQHLLNSCTELLFFEYFANLSIVISMLRVRVTKLM